VDLRLEEGLLLVLEPRRRQMHVVEGVPASGHTFDSKGFGPVKWLPVLIDIRPITINEWGFTPEHLRAQVLAEQVPAL